MYQAWERLKGDYKQIGFIFCLCICFFGNNSYLSFATDTYAVFDNFSQTSEWMIYGNGRLLPGLVYRLWGLCGGRGEVFYFVSHAAAVLFLAVAVYQLQDILKTYMADDFFRICSCFMTIANVFIIEYFMFLEKMMFLFGICMNVLALRCMVSYFQSRKTKYVRTAFGCMLLVVFTYQGTAALFVILCLPFVYRYADSFRGYIRNMLPVVFIYGLACVINLFVMAVIFKSERIQKSSSLSANVAAAIRGTVGASFLSFGIIPKFVFILFLCGVFWVSVLCIIRKYKGMYAWLQLGNLAVLYIGAVFAATAPILMGSGWFAPRVVYPYASILGIYVMNLYVNILNKQGRERTEECYAKNMAVVICIGMICFLSVQYLYFGKIVKDKYLNNFMDCYRCNMIGEKIKEYELETGIRIRNISFYRDGQPDVQYGGVFQSGDLVVSSFLAEWSDLRAVNYYLGTAYVKAEPEESYRAYFGSKDWKVFSDEQMVLEGDTLHMCVY